MRFLLLNVVFLPEIEKIGYVDAIFINTSFGVLLNGFFSPTFNGYFKFTDLSMRFTYVLFGDF